MELFLGCIWRGRYYIPSNVVLLWSNWWTSVLSTAGTHSEVEKKIWTVWSFNSELQIRWHLNTAADTPSGLLPFIHHTHTLHNLTHPALTHPHSLYTHTLTPPLTHPHIRILLVTTRFWGPTRASWLLPSSPLYPSSWKVSHSLALLTATTGSWVSLFLPRCILPSWGKWDICGQRTWNGQLWKDGRHSLFVCKKKHSFSDVFTSTVTHPHTHTPAASGIKGTKLEWVPIRISVSRHQAAGQQELLPSAVHQVSSETSALISCYGNQ